MHLREKAVSLFGPHAFPLGLLAVVPLSVCARADIEATSPASGISAVVIALVLFQLTISVVLYVRLRKAFRSLRMLENGQGGGRSELAEIGDRFELALETGNAGVWQWNLANGDVSFDEHFHNMLGYDQGDLPGKMEDWQLYHHPDDLPKMRARVQAYQQGSNTHFESEHRIRSKSGAWIWVLTRGRNASLTDAGNSRLFVGIAMNVTAKKTTQEALEREQMFTQTLLESLPGIFYLYSYPELRLVLWNRNHETLLGFDPGEIKDRHITAWHPPEAKDAVMAAIETVMREGQNSIESPLLAKDGSGVPFLMTGVRFEAQGQLYMMGVGIDISDRKRIEAEREKLEAQLRQSQKMEAVGQLAGGVAHDFNNLLQVILGNVSILLAGGSIARQDVETLGEVRRAAERAAELTRQLLAFGRRQIIQPVNLDLNDLVQGALKMLRRVIGEHIELRFIPSSEPLTIHADRGQLEQVLMNLCVNARDAMPNGGTLTLETDDVIMDDTYCHEHPFSLKGSYALLTVTDTGHGMDESTRAQIFEPFFTTKGVGEGTGLGLSTVYGIVKQHGGSVNVYSEPGRGTVFRVYFPNANVTVQPTASNSDMPICGGCETILVAEDEEMVRKLVVRILEGAGYRVLSAPNGEEAMKLFEAHSEEIDLLLLDVMMPKVGGREVMDRIQKVRPTVRVLFSSGYSQNALHTGFVIREGLRLISKPYSDTELLRAVRETLDSVPTDGSRTAAD